MGKFFSVSKNQAAVLSTILVLVLLGISYFFVYVPKNEKTVQERRFRCLQNIDNNIHSKIDNSISLLNTFLDAYAKGNRGKKGSLLHNSLQYTIACFPKHDFTLLPILPIQPNAKKREELLHSGNDSLVTVDADANSQQFKLYLSRVINIKKIKPSENIDYGISKAKPSDSLYLEMGIRYGFDQFIKKLLPADVFDNYIVLINDKKGGDKLISNKVVYETFPSGLTNAKRDSLLQIKNGIEESSMRNLKVGGTDYKMFLQPVSVNADSEWIIVGLVTDKNYQKEKNQLPIEVVLLLFTVVIGIIILLPWIKLYHMGNKDKLTVADGIASVLVSMLLMSLLFFVIFKYSYQYSPHYKKISSSADTLATHITSAFKKELDTAYQRLSECDSYYENNLNINNPGKGNINGDRLLKSISKGIDIHQVFWLDKRGIVNKSWSTGIKIETGLNSSERSYFKNIIAGRPNKTSRPEFYVDQLVSRASGVFTSVIAKKAIDTNVVSVAAIGFTVKSLDNVVMPDGFQFAVIDTNAEVLYHSLPERNLNENLMQEFADSSQLVSCLEAKSDTTFNAVYYGRQYKIKIKPIDHLPYFIVIFEDKEYNDARDTESYVFTSTMLVFLLVFLIIQFCVVFFASSKRSFFKKQLFDTSWIGPKINSHREYNLAIICNVAIIALLITFSGFCSFLEYLFILLFSITFVSIILNSLFAKRYKESNPYFFRFKKFAIISLCLFILVIDILAIFTFEGDHIIWLALFELTLPGVCLTLYYLGPDILALARRFKNKLSIPWTYTHSFALMATTRLIITSGIPVAFFFIYSFNYEQNLDMRYRQLNFARSLTQKIPRATITGEIDSIDKEMLYRSFAFFKYSDDTYTNTKPDKAGIVKFYPHKDCVEVTISNPFGLVNNWGAEKNYLDFKSTYPDGVFIRTIESDTNATTERYTTEDKINVTLLSVFRLLNNYTELRSNYLNMPTVSDEAYFNSLLKEHTEDYITATNYKISDKKSIKLSSINSNYALSFWFLLLLAILLILFFYIIHNIIRKLFALNLPSKDFWGDVDGQLVRNNKLNNLLFILGSPGSGKLSKLTELLKEGVMLCKKGHKLIYDEKNTRENNVFIADMILISADAGEDDPDWKKCKNEALNNKSMVIINHFEYNIKDARANKIKLDFLETLMQKGNSKIIIISTVHPITFLDSFNEQQNSSVSGQPQNNSITEDQQNQPIHESELERWQVLLGHFRIVIEPLEIGLYTEHSDKNAQSKVQHLDEAMVTQATENDDEINRRVLKKLIFYEVNYSHYLRKMQPIIFGQEPPDPGKITTPIFNSIKINGTQDIGPISDSLIFKLQISSHYFYTYIWQSLTKEEKFLLYDLAEEGLVNPYDDYNLSMLICKGLIININGTLILFNKGFRNFILTAIGNTELNRIKAQVKDNGNWGNLKAPLNLAIIAILAFLIISQQEAYSQIITYITALGAGIPVVLRLLSMIGNNSTQKTS